MSVRRATANSVHGQSSRSEIAGGYVASGSADETERVFDIENLLGITRVPSPLVAGEAEQVAAVVGELVKPVLLRRHVRAQGSEQLPLLHTDGRAVAAAPA